MYNLNILAASQSGHSVQRNAPFMFTPSPQMSAFQTFTPCNQTQYGGRFPPPPKLISPEFVSNQAAAIHVQVPRVTQNFQDFVPSVPLGSQFEHDLSEVGNQYLSPPNDLNKSRTLRLSSDEFNSDASTSSDSIQGSPIHLQKGKNGVTTCKQDRNQFVKEYKKKQKTEMCKNWEMKGICRWGNRCSYAHGAHEIVKKTHLPKNFMTKACEQFHKEQFCAYGKRCQFMHSERDIYAKQLYSTVLHENARLAKAKITTVDEFDSNAQIYINVFERKSRLACFASIDNDESQVAEGRFEDKSDFLSKGSDESDRLYEDFGEIAMKAATTLTKKRTGKNANKKKIVLQEVAKEKPASITKNFIQFNNDNDKKSGLKAGSRSQLFNAKQFVPTAFIPSY